MATRGHWQARRRHHHQSQTSRSGELTQLVPKSEMPSRVHRPRFLLIFGLLLLTGVVIAGQLTNLQVIQSGRLSDMAADHWRNARVLKTRGRLLDRNGIVLAQDSVVYDLYVHPRYFHGQTGREIATALAPYLKQPAAELGTALGQPYDTITLARNVSKTVKETIDKLRLRQPVVDKKSGEPVLKPDGTALVNKVPLNGLDWYRKTRRQYPQGRMASHLLGFFNDEAQVASGVEHTGKSLMTALAPRSKPSSADKAQAATAKAADPFGQKSGPVLLDGNGNPMDFAPESLRQVVEGNPSRDVSLTIDARLQFIAEQALREGVSVNKALRGMAIVMNPKNGEILAFAALPDFDPAQYYKEKDYSHLKNWALTDGYPPGSTMKILTVAFGLESGVITPFSRILDTGRMNIGGWSIANYDVAKRPHPGNIDLVYLFTHSSNIGSAKIAMDIPRERYEQLLRSAGFGSPTGIDLPGEASGLVHPSQSWDISTRATLGYGYGIIATPIQMAAAVASLANQGIWNPPHVIADPDHVTTLPVSRRVFSTETATAVTRLLSQSIAQSKTHPANLDFISVAGKTGTSRRPSEQGGYSNDLYTSFAGYFPAESPKLMVMVVVDSPHRAEAWGSTVAAPIFRKIATEAAHLYGISRKGVAKTVDGKAPLAINGRDG